ncbi:His/Gly/Thr/Pro-type tRNA ligase C-terminal domain-containing protein [Nocardia zapadnayensis]|nr:His/Gly/Thr/Pro-type tRNA ligase C-terminal domain-containing protein [Nocardia zapadnayensis]
MLIDDRPKTSPGVKFGDAELLGVPTVLVVGRGLADGTVELRDRRTGDSRDLAVAEAVTEIVRFIDEQYAAVGAHRTGR